MVYSLAYSCRGHMAFRELQGESIAGCIPNPKGPVVGAQVPQKKDWFHLPVECMWHTRTKTPPVRSSFREQDFIQRTGGKVANRTWQPEASSTQSIQTRRGRL